MRPRHNLRYGLATTQNEWGKETRYNRRMLVDIVQSVAIIVTFLGGVIGIPLALDRMSRQIRVELKGELQREVGLVREVLNAEIGGTKIELNAQLGSVRTELGSVRTELGSVRNEIGSVRTELGSVRDDLNAQIGSVRDELKTEIGSVRNEIGSVRQELKTDIGDLRKDLKAEIGGLRQEMYEGFTRVDARFDRLETKVDVLEVRSYQQGIEIAEIRGNLGLVPMRERNLVAVGS